MRLIVSLAVSIATLMVFSTGGAEAGACDPAKCVFPACVCPSLNPPKGLDPKTVPQFFTLTFDDAIQAPTVPVASALMAGLRNPNGCPARATWFAQTLYSDYSLIQQWYAAGNEVADHTMNHIGVPPPEEITGNRKAINAFAGIPFAKLSGFRAPFLNYSKSTFDTLAQEKFLYDSSVSALPATAYWPYTLDFGLSNDCWNGICDQPINAPQLWEIPMHATMDSEQPDAKAYSMDPQLSGTPEAVAGWLKANFNRHYSGARAPYGVYLHPVHVGTSTSMYNDFFKWALTQKDTWFVTNQQLLEWMKNPVPASELANQAYMKCNVPAIGKEICNGLDDTKAGSIDKGVLEVCNFPEGPWSTCYGCPKTAPSVTDPLPARVLAAGQPGARTPVPATCAMEWWDPIAAQCLCASANCTFTDISTIPTTTSAAAGPTSTSSTDKKPNVAVVQTSGTIMNLGLMAAFVAGMVQLL